MKQLVEYIARALVDKPEDVQLSVTPHEGGALYELRVAPSDIGKMIGRDGRTINALRTVLQHAAQKKGERARLEIVDERKAASTAPTPGPMPDEQPLVVPSGELAGTP